MKTLNKLLYISFFISAAWLSACSDDELLQTGPAGNPDAITFSAYSVEAPQSSMTRGSEEDTVYEPLVLTGEEDSQLFLHTYDSGKIGFVPGEDAEVNQPSTRGMQVKSVDDLSRFHNSFYVLANKKEDGSNYLGWSQTRNADSDNNIWYTDRTEYWPSNEMLTFHAVSPASELTNLQNLSAYGGNISFEYDARKGTQNKDAELQQDLLLSVYECNKSGSNSGRAPLEFHHALSAVKFAIRDVLGGEVVNVTISGVRSKGRCDFTYDAETKTGDISWSAQSGTASFSQNFNYEVSDRIVDPADDSKDEVLNDRMPEKTFMMIPQDIPADAEIIVTLKRTGMTPEQITLRGKIRDNALTTWLPGHEYVYTISTSKDNWVYVFDVRGNQAEGYDNIYVYSPNDDKFAAEKNSAYYSVKSYRYRANRPSYIENLPWTASFDGSEGYEVQGNSDVIYQGKAITAANWITDNHSLKFNGTGSTSFDKHNIDLYPHYLVTDWPGDKVMQNNAPYKQSMLDKSTPYDLSTFGGSKSRNTANCYIVDRGGWYSLPLVYGNAVVNGATNTGAYQCSQTTSTKHPVLAKMTDYNDVAISDPYIKNGASASLLWEDAYNMVRDVALVTIGNEKMIRFFVDKENLQQGNAIIALKDASGNIMWSWHIWATEHWLGSDGLPHKLSAKSSEFKFKLNPTTLVREKGDSEITKNQNNNTFYMSPYNLGWCDPKNVIYLKRKSRMDFIQYLPDKSKQTASASLDIIQQGETVNYKIGNNTYYQWGRKDPQVGFVDRKKNYKANFGPTSFNIANNKNKTLKDGIRNPHIMYVHTSTSSPPDAQQDWVTNQGYINLWNNHENVKAGDSSKDDWWNHQKTIYDPSPVGYIVPNAGIWNVLTNDGNKLSGSTWKEFEAALNGERDRKIDAEPDGIYVYKIYGTGTNSDESNVYLIPTGNRWYSNGHTFTQAESDNQDKTIEAGLNYNLRMFYGWSSRWNNSKVSYASHAGAVGIDAFQGENYVLVPHFDGRRAMGRPVRAIRDPNF
ncbi:MAG: fimbrillin family protein [Muribaculaceae bacterium]|nr:fimbrillin family protein [Muribaculaceae bacterium]